VATSCTYQGVRPSTALGVVQAWRGTTDRAIVVAAGSNDGSIGGAVDAIVDEARRQGVPYVVWLTYRVAGSNASTYQSHNDVLWQKTLQHPELKIADWAGYSAGNSGWVAPDGLHLNSSGAAAMDGLIATVLAELTPPPPPGPPPLAAGERHCFPVAPADGDAALVNLTPVGAAGPGFGTLTGSDTSVAPNASNVNFFPASVDPNLALARLGADGEVCYHNSPLASVHLVADHLGTLDGHWYTPARADGLPQRVVDSRVDDSVVHAGGRRCFRVAGEPGDVAVVNLTPVGATDPVGGHGALVSSDVVGSPAVSNVNFAFGTVDPNVAIAPIGADGRVCFVNAPLADVHLVADHLGTIDGTVTTPASPNGRASRRTDTRSTGASIPRGARHCFDVAGSQGDVAVVNLTPVGASGAGHGLLLSSDVPGVVDASNVNYAAGTVDPNVALAPIGADGRVCFVNAPLVDVHLVADHLVTIDAAAITTATSNGAPIRAVDTRT
jgi:hypothetical protein